MSIHWNQQSTVSTFNFLKSSDIYLEACLDLENEVFREKVKEGDSGPRTDNLSCTTEQLAISQFIDKYKIKKETFIVFLWLNWFGISQQDHEVASWGISQSIRRSSSVHCRKIEVTHQNSVTRVTGKFFYCRIAKTHVLISGCWEDMDFRQMIICLSETDNCINKKKRYPVFWKRDLSSFIKKQGIQFKARDTIRVIAIIRRG